MLGDRGIHRGGAEVGQGLAQSGLAGRLEGQFEDGQVADAVPGRGVVQGRADELGKPASSPIAALRERFGTWAAPIPQVLGAVTDADTGFFPHYRPAVPPVWGTGRITVIGDAAHSMPPTRAQGANQALEDAWALARALRTTADVPAALRGFERGRSPKAALVARQAGREDYNRYGALLTRLVPSALGSRYYTRWLGQISDYLTAGPQRGNGARP